MSAIVKIVRSESEQHKSFGKVSYIFREATPGFWIVSAWEPSTVVLRCLRPPGTFVWASRRIRDALFEMVLPRDDRLLEFSVRTMIQVWYD